VTAGSAEVVDVISGSEGGFDTVVVEMHWSAAVDGKDPEGRVHCLHLERAVGAQSKNGLSSLDCPSCRAALSESDAAFCAYCSAPLGGGKHEWSLLQVQVIE
jgi:hypothetical protein